MSGATEFIIEGLQEPPSYRSAAKMLSITTPCTHFSVLVEFLEQHHMHSSIITIHLRHVGKSKHQCLTLELLCHFDFSQITQWENSV